MELEQIENPIDELGYLKAKIADMEARYDEIANAIKSAGSARHDGVLFRATVSEVKPTLYLDVKSAEAKLRELGVTDSWFAENYKTKAGYVMLKVGAR
jgi:hypothetical protein